MDSPCRKLTDTHLALGDYPTPPGQHQLGDRLQIDHIGLHPPPTRNPALLSNMSRVQFEHLPLGWPPVVQHRPVIMPGRLNTNLDLGKRRDNGAQPIHDRTKTRASHRKLDRTQHTPTGAIRRRQQR